MEIHSRWRVVGWVAGLALLFVLYTSGLRHNPPGFYMDESAIAYNAYLVAHTGAGEFGPRFPLFFECYDGGWMQIAQPVQIYLLALVFVFLPPSILLVRLFSAFWLFAACILLGLLAKQISGKRTIGVIVAASALLIPWFFEARGLLLESQFVPMGVAPLLLAAYHVQKKEKWSWLDAAMLAGGLTFLTYCYTSGRVLGPLFGLGLLFFATTWQRFVGVIKTGLLYTAAVVPLLVFNWRHPGILARRFQQVSYIKAGVPWRDLASQFVNRYLEDQSLTALLMTGDPRYRHHVQVAGGALFFGTFILALIGLLIVIASRRNDPWWRFILFGLVVSIVPGAIATDAFHALRLMAYPVFILVLTVPALEWFLARDKDKVGPVRTTSGETEPPATENYERLKTGVVAAAWTRSLRLGVLSVLLALTAVEAVRFHTIFRREGPHREYDFDFHYKAAYDLATAQPARPIYLEDGYWGPAYIHALWYAAMEKRPRSEFVHLSFRSPPPSGGIVISSEKDDLLKAACPTCVIIKQSGLFTVYKKP